MENIRVVQLIDSENCSIFISEALRYYSREIVNQQAIVPLYIGLREPFFVIAEKYLDWDKREVKRVIDRIDNEQQSNFLTKLNGEPEASLKDGVNWTQIEDSATKGFE